MWKLVKAEILYYKLPIIICYAYFISGIFILKLMITYYYGPIFYVFAYIFSFNFLLPILYIILIVAFLIIDNNENRIRQISSLPITPTAFGYARFINPIIAFLLFSILLFLCNISFCLTDRDSNTPTTNYMVIWNFLIVIPWLILILTFYIRLFAEWQGRIIFFIVLILILPISYAIFSSELEPTISRPITDFLSSSPGVIFLLLLPFIFAFLTFRFFVSRKSYLN